MPPCKIADAAVLNWDDVRYAMAIGEWGSVAAAASALALDPTTVARRLKALEQAVGTPLFERLKGRLTPTAAGEVLLQRGSRMAQEAAALSHLGSDLQRAVEGTLRLTVIDTLAAHFIVHHLPKLRAQYPGLRVELVTSSSSLDLSRREADLALRLARPASGDFVAQLVAHLGYAVYASPSVSAHALPWLAYDHDLRHVPEMRWLAHHLPPAPAQDDHIALRCNNIDALANASAQGLGRVALPTLVGDRHPGLQRCIPLNLPPPPAREIWLLAPRELRHVPRIEAGWQWLVSLFEDHGQDLAHP